MRRLPLLLLALSACSREPEPPPPAPGPLPGPRPPIVNRIPAAPLERIAFVREDGLWTVSADGSDLKRIVPPTLPQAAEPVWAPDRRWIAFTAALHPEANLYPRNVFVARPDGAELRQVTPMARAGISVDDLPKGIVRGRAVRVGDAEREALPGFRVTAFGLRRAETTDHEGNFQTYLPVGGGWVKVSGELRGRPAVAWRFAASIEGRVTDLKDIALTPGGDDTPGSPAWCGDGQLLYVLRHPLVDHKSGSPLSTLRRIRSDGTGDETVASFAKASIIAGPVVRGDSAWCKTSDGMILRYDLRTKTLAESRAAGISAPDVLAVSPDGAAVATLTMDETGARSLVLLRKDATEPLATFKPGEPAPQALDFSPDGARLVMDRHGSDGKSGLWILTLASRQLALLLEGGSSPVWHGR